MLIKDIFFDMDDTLTDTNGYLKREIKNALVKAQRWDAVGDFRQWLKLNKTTLEIPKSMGNLSMEYGLKDGDFMLKVERAEMVWSKEWFGDFLQTLKDAGIRIHVCTHRGWHALGREHTIAWLKEQGWLHYFTDVIVLDSKDNPDKLTYLSEHYQDFIIVDDNPLHDLVTIHPKDDRIILCNGKANYPGYVNQTKINTLPDLEAILTERYGITF